jgi:sodium-dependent dicarboxylate transporter 2/3/5
MGWMPMQISRRMVGFLLGPISFVSVLLFVRPEGLASEGIAILACAIWVAIWWITEAMPLAATALLPVVLFPLTGGLALRETLSGYSHPYIFLFIGGFMLAIAIEKWNLHRRIALVILRAVGSKKPNIVLGTAFLSMWISNTATAAMMLPIGMALIHQVGSSHSDPFGKALMLGIAYSASIGGMATLIGTPPNLILAGVIQKTFGWEISFFGWMKFALPFSLVMLAITWKYLTGLVFRLDKKEIAGGKAEIDRQLAALGPMGKEEKRVLAVFVLTALAWMGRTYVITPFLPEVDDTIVAITAALALFVIPAGKSSDRLLEWEDTARLPWGILLLFGGGIALAAGFDKSGLSVWLGSQLFGMQGLSVFVLLLVVIAVVNFLTEITSNLATTAMLLPILASLAGVLGIDPFVLMAGATLAASCAFMLPVATPPNAIVFGSGKLDIGDMLRAGFGLNLISILLLAVGAWLVLN